MFLHAFGLVANIELSDRLVLVPKIREGRIHKNKLLNEMQSLRRLLITGSMFDIPRP